MMMERLQEIMKKKKIDIETFMEIHHRFMKEYGWIPLEEMKSMPIPMMLLLNRMINRDIERQTAEMEKWGKK